jgi:acetyl esterase/lipase
MGLLKNSIVISVILAGLFAYWLYSPIPDGYIPGSAFKIHISLAAFKLLDFVTYGAYKVGIGTSDADNVRRLSTTLMELLVVKQPDPELKITEHLFDGVPVRLYEPTATVHKSDKLPGFVFIHGGGYTLFDLDTYDHLCRNISKRTNAVVASVDYRLAPEYIYPTQFDDSLTATKYFIKNANKFGVDVNRIAVGGDSAGGNLAAAVSLKLRDEKFKPALKLQVLIYPHLQSLDFQLPSMLTNKDGPLITRRKITYFISMYLQGNDDLGDVMVANKHIPTRIYQSVVRQFVDPRRLPERYLANYRQPSARLDDADTEALWSRLSPVLLDPYNSPLTAKHLKDLPKTYVFTAEYDPLRDDGLLYVGRLRRDGVDVEHHHSDIGFHGIYIFVTHLPEADAVFDHLVQYLLKNL